MALNENVVSFHSKTSEFPGCPELGLDHLEGI